MRFGYLNQQKKPLIFDVLNKARNFFNYVAKYKKCALKKRLSIKLLGGPLLLSGVVQLKKR